jgi:CHASE2 domain-containing sensor protein
MSKLRNLKFWWGAILTGTLITLSLSVVRLSGLLQPAEWSALDWLFQSRSLEPPDRRIVIVGIDETDLQKLNKYPIDDLTLAKLIGKIKAQNPQVIGLDLHRDLPVPPGHSQLVKVFQSTSNLIGVEKVIGTKIAPPPVLAKLGQTAASDVVIDGDGVLRRALLFPQTPEKPSLPTLGLAVALKYLEKEKIQPVSGEGGWLKLDKVTFFPFEKNDGGYRNTDAGSYQILLNFRGGADTFLQVSLDDVLENRVKSDFFANRLVLIGSSAVSLKDSFYTPYSKGLTTTPQRTYGVEIHAQVASQIISAVLDSRPLLKVWSEPVEKIWIFLWIALPSIVYWQCRFSPKIVKLLLTILFASSAGTVILIGSVKWAFIQGWWLPVIPNLLGLWGATFLSILCIYLARLIEHKENLETQVKLRTQELAQALQALRATQQKILAQDKLAYLGFLTTGIAHEIKNPLNLIFNYLDLAQELNQELFNLSQVKTSFFLAEGLQKKSAKHSQTS